MDLDVNAYACVWSLCSLAEADPLLKPLLLFIKILEINQTIKDIALIFLYLKVF